MEKLKAFYIKYLKNYIMLLVVIAIAMNLLIETLARHSLFESLGFLFTSPLVFLCNVLIILAVISLSLLFRKRIFFICLFCLPWLALGTRDLVLLANRMTPFTVKDLSSLEDGLSIVTNYFSIGTIILGVAGIVALVLGFIILYRKTPKLKEKIDYRKAAAVIVVIIVAAFGTVQISIKAGVLDTFFGNLAYAYRDNGVPYCFLVTWVSTGIDRPADYSEEAVKSVFDDGELGEDGIYTPGRG